MNSIFFYEDADTPYTYDKNLGGIKEEEGVFYERGDVPYKEIPPVLQRIPWGKNYVITPRSDWNTILIPFSPGDYEEKHFKGRLLSDFVTSLIRDFAGNKLFVASADPEYFTFVEIKKIRYDLFWRASCGNGMVPFFLFDSALNFCFGFDFEFEFSFFSSPLLKEDNENIGGSFAEWDQFFLDNFGSEHNKDTAHEKFFEEYLRPSISLPMGIYKR